MKNGGNEYEMVAGVEVHVQLKTESKMFCPCKPLFAQPPNSQVCPICLGMPGVLPVINRRAFELAMSASLALNCSIAPLTKFDRKNYFYPDLPKSYQISQYDMPLATNGELAILCDGTAKKIGIMRLHMEEDAGKLVHQEGGAASLVDMNRAGVPLVEIVSMPHIRSAAEAYEYLTALKAILQYIEVSECDMEKGELRCDVNVSVRKRGTERFGTKVEIKNLNSFKNASRALEFEFQRQVEVLESGGTISQETRLFDAERGTTAVMRSKEEAHDYRYFPEPDIPPVRVDTEWIAKVRQKLPELPAAMRARFVERHELSEYDAGVLTSDKALASFYEQSLAYYDNAKAIANWTINDLMRILNDKRLSLRDAKMTPRSFAELIRAVDRKEITNRVAKDILGEAILSGKDPAAIVMERGLKQVDDAGELEKIARTVIESQPQAVADYKGGKASTLTFLVGQVMKVSKGRANPQVAAETIKKILGVN